MKEQYTYDAFISYRHSELDQFVAEYLHKALETFKPPKSILKQGKASRSRIERVFRDRDELPITSNLEDPIVQALIHSEFLIVICSPRLKESVWCKKEIETFIQYHGKEKVLTVLIEGEPEDSFPEELLYVEETVIGADGAQETIRKPVEPLAADVRGENKKEIQKRIRSEMLRLLAPMFGVGYDDLRQRHRERMMKKIITASIAVSVLCLTIGLASTIAALHIQKQKEQIQKQSEEIKAQSDEIKTQSDRIGEQSLEIQKQNEILAVNQAQNLAEKALSLLDEGDRIGAIETAVQALTEYEGIEMPYTAAARYALAESLHIYDSGSIIKVQNQITAPGVIENVVMSPDRNTVITIDATDSLCVWNILTGELIDTLPCADVYTAVFIDNNRIIYADADNGISIYDAAAERVIGNIESDTVNGFSADPFGGYVAVKTWSELTVYDTTDFKPVYHFEETENSRVDAGCFFSESGTMVYTEIFAEDQETGSGGKAVLHFIDLQTGEASSLSVKYDMVKNILFKNECAYILASNASGDGNDYYAGVVAFDIKSGTKKWEKKFEGKGVFDISIQYTEGADNLMMCSAMEGFILDEHTGEETGHFTTASSIVGIGAYVDTNQFMIFTQNGHLYVYVVEMDEIIGMDAIFECKSENVESFYVSSGGFLVRPFNDNRITVYNAAINPDIKPYEGELAGVPDDDSDRDFVYEAEQLGLTKASLASCILTVPDQRFIIVSYRDSTIEIYNTADMSLIETIREQIGDANKYFGEDQEGNLYIGGDHYGYCLDSSGNLIARIEDLSGVVQNNNKIIVDKAGNLKEMPIYTTQELVELGRAAVEDYKTAAE